MDKIYMRKIPHKYENFIDNILLDICEGMTEPFKKMGFTPNLLTTISLIFGLFSGYNLYNRSYGVAALLFAIAYFFDCMDGHFARKYNMVTDFGDYYDHFCDLLKIILILVLLYYISINKFIKIIPLLLITSMLLTLHMGCQEEYYKINNNEIEQPFLGQMSSVCKNNSLEYLPYTKYFGCGTFFTILTIIIWNYDQEYILFK
jgi:phosphatidylglycerophosphate synthase